MSTLVIELNSVILNYSIGYVECDPPNNKLHKFVGNLAWNDHVYSLNNEKILLRVSLG